ncbi:MAG: hypothetical protein ACXWM1_01890, partial [Candidatus Binataceae bacterium]
GGQRLCEGEWIPGCDELLICAKISNSPHTMLSRRISGMEPTEGGEIFGLIRANGGQLQREYRESSRVPPRA